MFVKKLHLENFRLFSQLLLEFDQQVTVIVAPNAMGKSSVAEAIRLLSVGQSFRAGKIEEMIKIGQELGRVRAKVVDSVADLDAVLQELGELELSVLISRGMINGTRTHKLLFSVNENRRQKKKFIGQLLTVVFRPEDMRLVEGSPGRRRDYLDSPLQLTDYEYSDSLGQYAQTLRRRNRLLSLIRDGRQNQEVLTYWDLSLIKHGERLQKKRRELIDFINAEVESPLPMKIEYQPSLISKKRILDHREAEIATGFTLVGPHKDDFDLLLNLDQDSSSLIDYKSLNAYGSRGQKRMGVVWLKKAELVYLKQQTKRSPVLILDDILSELDQDNQQRVLDLIDGEQVIITTVDSTLITEIKKKFQDLKLVELAKL